VLFALLLLPFRYSTATYKNNRKKATVGEWQQQSRRKSILLKSQSEECIFELLVERLEACFPLSSFFQKRKLYRSSTTEEGEDRAKGSESLVEMCFIACQYRHERERERCGSMRMTDKNEATTFLKEKSCIHMVACTEYTLDRIQLNRRG
jgi:hypothetical protein